MVTAERTGPGSSSTRSTPGGARRGGAILVAGLQLPPHWRDELVAAGILTVSDLWRAMARGEGRPEWATRDFLDAILEALDRYIGPEGRAPGGSQDPAAARSDGPTTPRRARALVLAGLPTAVAQGLRERGLATREALQRLAVADAVRVKELVDLGPEVWSVIVERAPKACASDAAPPAPEAAGALPLEDLGLSTRAYNGLRRGGITEVQQLLRCTLGQVAALRGLGALSFTEILAKASRAVEEERDGG